MFGFRSVDFMRLCLTSGMGFGRAICKYLEVCQTFQHTYLFGDPQLWFIGGMLSRSNEICVHQCCVLFFTSFVGLL